MSDLHNEFEKSRHFNTARMDRRNVNMLAGLAAGVTADGVITLEEAQFLRQWIESQMSHLDDPVVNILYQRISSMLQDGVLDEDESTELLETLRGFAGISAPGSAPSIHTAPTPLPLCQPAPHVECDGNVFVFTGTMAFGPRKECERLVRERGGAIGPGVSKKVDYLVIGSIGNEQWLHSSYGTKILRAVELRENGTPIAIIAEDHWQRILLG
ncbi:NAD-dependent DNA ligase [Pseudomonas sp. FH4]|uniref:BRCT domain-containing protein n=1 Tax=Pseudomonas fluorescens group TaxID=136843 RepID=UPI0003DCBD01|nr:MULTISPECIES: BRCT domain-containing protein [Pseudomonas fluorescens group]ETK19800.1 NAD-dependent DNA ligase [Pseudomonas sp. FH4]MBF8005491.1 BRCT domain-containing protein [Pseudomonas brenneri]